MKVLFFHNTAPDYRIPFFIKLSQKLNIRFVFTDMNINKKVYGNNVDTVKLNKLDYGILSNKFNAFKEVKNEIYSKEVKFVVIPPLDNIKDIIKGIYIYKLCKQTGKYTFYFWEKWEAPKSKQPMKRRIKELGLKILVKPILKNVNLCLVPGEKTAEYLTKLGIKKENIMHIHDCSEAPICAVYDIKERYSISKNRKIILYYGRITRKKGLDNLLKAYAKTDNKYKNDTYIIVAGDGEFRPECEKLAKDLNIENIQFVGYVNPDYRYLYFSQCDIFVLPGRIYNGSIEAWGLTLNEALQFGKILISTTSVGAAYELITSNNGFMVQENNIDELTNALIKANSDNLKKSAFQECNKIFNKYNFEVMSNDILASISKFKNQIL